MLSERTHRVLGIALTVGLVLVGGLSLLRYLSVPVHQVVLLTEQGRTDVSEACSGGSWVCQGMVALVPFVIHTFGWVSPFAWYAVWSLVFLGAVFAAQCLRTGERKVLKLRMKPWHLLLLFVGSLWLIFNVIGMGSNDELPMRRLVEPIQAVYPSLNEDALGTLQDSYHALLRRDCLTEVGQTQSGAHVYDLKFRCMETAFVTRVLSQLLVVLGFLFEILVLGRLCLHLMGLRIRQPLLECMVSAGTGACALIALLWTAAIAYVYTESVGWGILIAIPLIGFTHARYWIRQCFTREIAGTYRWYSVTLLLVWFLITYLAFNFLNVVRPFPIGWDDLGRYLNQPRLLVSYGHFIPSMATFMWEYLTSLGFLLFGFDSVFGATASMMINWTAGLLAVLSIYTFGRVFLGPRAGLLSAILYYTLPLVGHFSFADMKVDNAVFTMGALGILCFFVALFPIAEEDADAPPERDWKWMMIAGLLSGFAFAMKPTAVMVLMALATVVFAVSAHWSAFFGIALLAWAFYTHHGEFNVKTISQYVYSTSDSLPAWLVYAVCLGLGIPLVVYAFLRNRAGMIRGTKLLGIFMGSVVLAMTPWLIYNNIQYGNIVPSLIMGAPDHISPIFSINPVPDKPYPGQDVRILPEELRPNMEDPACKSTSRVEELDRYWGFSKGWGHYLTLPWRTVMNLDSAGYYVTTIPALLLFPLLLLLPFAWTRRGRPVLWLGAATAFMLAQWVFFANGIPWYGIGMFLGLSVTLEALTLRAPYRATRAIAGIFVTLSLCTALSMRFWQFDQQRNLFEYPLGKVSAEGIRKRTIPHYDTIRDYVVDLHDTNPERPYVYRIGTFIPYFIPKNLEYLPMTDNQLDFFNCLNQERDAQLTLKRLEAFGFSSVIFDTNTQTIEKDENGTLHKKVQYLLDFLNAPGLGLQVVVNDTSAGVAYVVLP